MLAVKVDFETKQATIGTQAGSRLPVDGILAALDSLGYRGEVVKPAPPSQPSEDTLPKGQVE